MSDQPNAEIVIECHRQGSSGKFNVAVRLAGGDCVMDQINLFKADAREAFAARVCDGRIGITSQEIASKLAEIAADELGKSGSSKKLTQADRLVELILGIDGIELFHAGNGDAYATVPIGNHRETLKVSSKPFRTFVAHRFYDEHGKSPSSQALQDAIVTIAGHAQFKGPEHPVHVRIAECDGVIWVDLCDPSWRAIRVGQDGWSVMPSGDVPVKFVRKKYMQVLPEPVLGGLIEELRPLLNMTDDDEAWTLTVGWLIGAFHPRGPYGVLSICGEHGSAKSTTAKLLRRVLDPNDADLRRLPRDERDVFIAAGNSWVCSYNNLSGMSNNLSDALCALATDGGFGTRTLYENDDESIFTARRPVILNGIEPPATRPDLVDRTISISLKTIPEDERRRESDIYAEFARVHPRVIGALLNAVASALRNRDKVKLKRLPRMADQAVWITAGEPGLGWKQGTFIAAIFRNRAEANIDVFENSAISTALIRLVDDCPFTGNWTELLAALERARGEQPLSKDWPQTHMKLRSDVVRLAPSLRTAGYRVDLPEGPTGHANRRVVYLEKLPKGPVAPFAHVADHAEGPPEEPSPEEWAALDEATANGANGANAPPPTQSSDASAEVAS